ncbi:MAG: hypothetical protein C5S49_01685 [Candidatus Methanogaster sp.]|nr:MAG: hypothetical protein C5S49_01685 [ANME-2 cluster archaeon]
MQKLFLKSKISPAIIIFEIFSIMSILSYFFQFSILYLKYLRKMDILTRFVASSGIYLLRLMVHSIFHPKKSIARIVL